MKVLGDLQLDWKISLFNDPPEREKKLLLKMKAPSSIWATTTKYADLLGVGLYIR